MKVEVVETAEQFRGLREDWDALQQTASPTSVFASWAWQYQWWETYGTGRSLRLVLVRDGEKLVAILPVYLGRQRLLGGLKAWVLRFVGTGGDTHPDDLGPLLAAGEEPRAAAALADFLLAALPGWDVVHLTDMHSASVFATALRERLRQAGGRADTGVSAEIPYVELPATWEAYLGTLSARRRNRLRSDRRKLGGHFFVWEDADRLDEAVDRLVELHRRRWQTAGQSHSFASPEYVAFHRAVMKACLDRGWLRLYCLEREGQLVAMSYFYRFRNSVFLMQAGFDPAFAELRPGHVLTAYALEHAIGEGNDTFDFLRGHHQYKDELATARRETSFLTGYRRTGAALAYRALHRQLPALKQRVKRWLRGRRPASGTPAPLA